LKAVCYVRHWQVERSETINCPCPVGGFIVQTSNWQVFQLSSCFTLLCTTTFSVSSYSQQSDAARPGGGQALARHGGSDRCSDGLQPFRGHGPYGMQSTNQLVASRFVLLVHGPFCLTLRRLSSCLAFKFVWHLTRRQERPPPGRPTLGCQFRCIFRRDHYTTGTGGFKFKIKNIHLSPEP
jgi:hypothetical protein